MAADELNEYFREQTNERFDKIELRFDAIDKNLSEILKFKWQIVGGSVALSVLMTLFFQVVIYFSSKGG